MGAKKNIRYHIVLAAKYRRKSLDGIENSVIKSFENAEKRSSLKIEKIAIEDGDHVHLVIRTSGTYALSNLVSRLKSLTTHYLWETEGRHLSKHYWGNKKKLWSGGYYASTIGDVSIKHIKKYLQKQGHWK